MVPVHPPILMFHSIADHLHTLPWKPIICSTGTFERVVSHLAKAEYKSLSLSDYLGCLKGGDRLPRKTIVITFDDGYLDNWVNAFPILRKYGMKATVFVSTDFIDPTEIVRKTLEDYWDGETAYDELDWYGYLSWNELRVMSGSGLFEIGSHTMTHTWHFGSPEVVDFHHPGDAYVWLDWNRNPSIKPFWLKMELEKNWGSPVYRHGPALTTRIFTPGDGLERIVTDHVASRGGISFFESGHWRKELLELVRGLNKEPGFTGTFEGEKDFKARQRHELIQSRKLLEQGLGGEIAALAWPNDAHTSQLTRIAHEEAGYGLTCTVEKRENGTGTYPCVSRMFVGEKYGSSLLNEIWFKAKIRAAGSGRFAGSLRTAARFRRQLSSIMQTKSSPEENS
jgi:hypothetical protein